jgi:ribosomal protein S18 acetylase RimI-like enzyme
MGQMAIVPLQARHCREIAAQHMAFLPTPFGGVAGKKLLSLYYNVLANGIGGRGFVATGGAGILGYVCGIWEPEAVRRALFSRHGFPLAWFGIFVCLNNPKMIRGFCGRVGAQNHTGSKKVPIYELRPIVLAPNARGRGIGGRLVQRLKEDASKLGFGRIFLKVDPGNQRAVRFYLKNGFEFSNEITDEGFQFMSSLTEKTCSNE